MSGEKGLDLTPEEINATLACVLDMRSKQELISRNIEERKRLKLWVAPAAEAQHEKNVSLIESLIDKYCLLLGVDPTQQVERWVKAQKQTEELARKLAGGKK